MILDRHDADLLRAVLDDGDRARAAFAAWRGAVDFEALSLAQAWVIPSLHRRIREWGLDERDPLLGRMAGLYRRNWYRNQIVITQGRAVLAALAAAGIARLVLKGGACFAVDPDSIAVRGVTDLDVMVPWPRAREAIAIIEGLGWRAADRRARAALPDMLATHNAMLFRGPATDIDLHWRPLPPQVMAADRCDLWARARPAKLGGIDVRVPAPEDGVIHVLMHAALWNAAPRLDWAIDVAAAIRREGDRFDWTYVRDRARDLRAELIVARYLDALTRVAPIAIPAASRRRRWRPALLQRLELTTRGVAPDTMGAVNRLWLQLQAGARARPRRAFAAARALTDLGRRAWAMDDSKAVIARAVYIAAGRPGWATIAADPRAASLAGRELVPTAQTRIEFGEGVPLGRSLVFGWSFAEATGRWTCAREALLALRVHQGTGDLALALDCEDFVPAGGFARQFAVWANAVRIDRWRADAPAAVRRMRVPRAVLRERPILSLWITASRLLVPRDFGLNDDRRPLGLFVKAIDIADQGSP